MKWYGTKWERAWEWVQAVFWLSVSILIIAYNHPKVQKMLSTILPAGTWEDKGK